MEAHLRPILKLYNQRQNDHSVERRLSIYFWQKNFWTTIFILVENQTNIIGLMNRLITGKKMIALYRLAEECMYERVCYVHFNVRLGFIRTATSERIIWRMLVLADIR